MERTGDWQVAREGIQLLLNNQISEAEQLFGGYKDNVQMAAGYCFVTFMNALMTFEDEKLQESLSMLKEMERRCAGDVGWLKAMKNKVFGDSSSEQGMAERLEQQVILADSQVCVALLTFLQQDLAGYVRGGWVLRKAWKVYQHTYNQILALYKQYFPMHEPVPGSQFPTWHVMARDSSHPELLSPAEWSVPSSAAATPTPSTNSNGNGFVLNGFISSSPSPSPSSSSSSSVPATAEQVARLMAAVSFGYGVFQLCVSLLPPSLLKLIHLLGFEGDRQLGIAALMFARQGRDMRAPLASLALLWYHTIVRPFFALDGANVRAGVEAAQQLITESQEEFAQSALFLFFRGRVERLKSNVDQALAAYEAAVERSPQREVQLLCLHEVGWCHLIQLDWPAALSCFLQLKKRSRWSQAFYAYLAAVCAGASGDSVTSSSLAVALVEVVGAGRTGGGGQLEQFVQRRARRMVNAGDDADASFCRLLAFELLFLWNALPSCSPQHATQLLEDCQSSGREPMRGLRHLVMGAVQGCLGRPVEAAACFRTCLARRAAFQLRVGRPANASPKDEEQEHDDDHVAAFALYELGAVLVRDPQTLQEGRSLLVQAQSDYQGYDFENRLSVRIHAALRQCG